MSHLSSLPVRQEVIESFFPSQNVTFAELQQWNDRAPGASSLEANPNSRAPTPPFDEHSHSVIGRDAFSFRASCPVIRPELFGHAERRVVATSRGLQLSR